MHGERHAHSGRHRARGRHHHGRRIVGWRGQHHRCCHRCRRGALAHRYPVGGRLRPHGRRGHERTHLRRHRQPRLHPGHRHRHRCGRNQPRRFHGGLVELPRPCHQPQHHLLTRPRLRPQGSGLSHCVGAGIGGWRPLHLGLRRRDGRARHPPRRGLGTSARGRPRGYRRQWVRPRCHRHHLVGRWPWPLHLGGGRCHRSVHGCHHHSPQRPCGGSGAGSSEWRRFGVCRRAIVASAQGFAHRHPARTGSVVDKSTCSVVDESTCSVVDESTDDGGRC